MTGKNTKRIVIDENELNSDLLMKHGEMMTIHQFMNDRLVKITGKMRPKVSRERGGAATLYVFYDINSVHDL